jgi:cytochrome b pre-mRNA-processing protein 3
MDENMREMGVGDLAVPGKMRRIGEAFYARQRAYRAGLAARGDGELAQALERNVFAGGSQSAGAVRLARYLQAAVEGLARQGNFERGVLVFPNPLAVPPCGNPDRPAQ